MYRGLALGLVSVHDEPFGAYQIKAYRIPIAYQRRNPSGPVRIYSVFMAQSIANQPYAHCVRTVRFGRSLKKVMSEIATDVARLTVDSLPSA